MSRSWTDNEQLEFWKQNSQLNIVQGVFFNWASPKGRPSPKLCLSSPTGPPLVLLKKLKYMDWSSPKITKLSKCWTGHPPNITVYKKK